MEIRDVTSLDKEFVSAFCQNTFSWGDYIIPIWDFWVNEGNFYTITESDRPVSICHGFISDDQVWIEGIRVHPEFQRGRLASKLVSHVEDIAKAQNCKTAAMLIEASNQNSLLLSEHLKYSKREKWFYYDVIPQKTISKDVKFADCNIDLLSSLYYVNSWRWLPLNSKTIPSLIKNNQVITSSLNNCIGIMIPYAYFKNTLIVTIPFGNYIDITEIIKFIENYSHEHKYKNVHVITKLDTIPSSSLAKRFEFYLVDKKL